MNRYGVTAIATKGNLEMRVGFWIEAHNIKSAYDKSFEDWKCNRCTSKLEIVSIIKAKNND